MRVVNIKSFRLSLPTKVSTTEGVNDVVVIGAGPAGLSAALYLARFKVKVLVVTKDVGGTLNEAGLIDDYIGLPEIRGPELGRRMAEHVMKYGVPIVTDEVINVVKTHEGFKVITKSGREFRCKAVILAVGSRRRRLGVPGEDKFVGKGVSYCAACDAPLFKGKIVAVVGGGNAALQAALLLSSYAVKVYLIHRRLSFRAFPIYVDMIKERPNIVTVLNSVITEVGGKEHVEWVKVKDRSTNEEKVIKVDGVFVEIGSEPPKDFFLRLGLEVDERGYVVVGPNQETSIKGIFAAGDCTVSRCRRKFDQVITAAADGALAALSTYEYLLNPS